MRARAGSLLPGRPSWASRHGKIMALLAALVIGGGVGYWGVRSQAASSYVAFEAESSTLSGGAVVNSDAAASGGKYVQFADTTPSPPPPGGGVILPGSVDVKASCRNTTTTANGTSIRTNFPHDANTGPEVAGLNEDKLPPSGKPTKWVISTPGAVVDSVYHNGYINVTANNVTIKNSVICGSGTNIIDNDASGLVVENSIIRGERLSDGSQPCQNAIGYGNFTVYRSELSGCADGAKVSNRVEIHDSWFHDNYTNRLGGGSGTHNDTIQMAGTSISHFVFRGNAAYQDSCTSNRHFQAGGREGMTMTIAYFRWENNFMYGIKGFNIGDSKGVVNVTDGLIANNTFAGSASQGPFSPNLYSGNGNQPTKSGNKYESGESANSNFPSSYTCVSG